VARVLKASLEASSGTGVPGAVTCALVGAVATKKLQ